MESVRLKNGKSLFIRGARGEDAEKLTGFLNAVGGESNFLTFGKDECRISAEKERILLENKILKPPNLFLVGFVEDELICCANLSVPQGPRVFHNGEMGITVRKKYWHLGAGTAVLGELLSRARENPGLKTIRLGVYENNGRAIRLYRKFGFEYAGCLRNYFRVGEKYYDEVLMELPLRRP